MLCAICGESIKGSCKANCHIGCHLRKYPPKVVKTIRELLFADDQVVTRELLLELLTEQIGVDTLTQTLDKYNDTILRQWQHMCDIYQEKT